MEFCLPNLCFFLSIKFNTRNIIFNQRPILINEINSNSNKNCKNYYHQYKYIPYKNHIDFQFQQNAISSYFS